MVAFSGVEGAGKSTQSRVARDILEARGVRCEAVEFISLGLATRISRAWHRLRRSRPRARDFGAIARSQGGQAGSGAAPRWKLSHLRHALTHVADAVLLLSFLSRCEKRGIEVVVFDRYFFDALVRWNLPPALDRALEALTPAPDLAFLLEADPATVESRRGEGSGAVAERRARAFDRAATRHPEWIRLRSEDADETRRAIEQALDAWTTGR